MLLRKLTAVALWLATPIALQSAHAQAPAINVMGQKVPYGDLNLRNAADVETLNRRVSNMAWRACNARGDRRLVRSSMAARACSREAMAEARAQIEGAIGSSTQLVARQE
jgi:UrcA family protein